MDYVANGIAALGLAGGALGFLYGRAASKKADIAKADAATALTRSAAALERANELHEAMLAPNFEWTVRQITQAGYRLYADGPLRPSNAEITDISTAHGLVEIRDGGPRNLLAGDSLLFIVKSRRGGTARPTIRVTWDDTREPEVRQQQDFVIPEGL